MDIERFRPYWLVTCTRATFTFLVVVGLLVGGLMFAGQLDHFEFLGFPLGVLLLGQGLVFLVIGVMFWFVHAQGQTDEQSGANEDL